MYYRFNLVYYALIHFTLSKKSVLRGKHFMASQYVIFLVFTIFHVAYLIHIKEILNKLDCSNTLNNVLLKSVQAKELF